MRTSVSQFHHRQSRPNTAVRLPSIEGHPAPRVTYVTWQLPELADIEELAAPEPPKEPVKRVPVGDPEVAKRIKISSRDELISLNARQRRLVRFSA